jgi:adenylosuccinate synthase
MIINQIIEDHRGDKKHGSCGVGFNETIERSADPKFRLQVKDLYDQDKFLSILKRIVSQYLPQRLSVLGIEKISDFYRDILTSPIAVENYFRDCMFFISQIEMINDIILMIEDNIIFEGAQGLLLDQDHHYFPHVTRSKTGIHNVLELISESDIDNLDITYVTRPYVTRHGAGPFPHELPNEPMDCRIINETNIHNKYQGSLRFGYLDVGLLRSSIHEDIAKINGMTYNYNIAITCMDQVVDKVIFTDNKMGIEQNKEGFIDYLTNEILPHSIYAGNGPTRNDIERSFPWK